MDEDVEAAKCLQHPVGDGPHLGLLLEVDGQREDLHAVGLGQSPGRGLGFPIQDHESRSLLREGLCHGLPDVPGASGDEGHATLEVQQVLEWPHGTPSLMVVPCEAFTASAISRARSPSSPVTRGAAPVSMQVRKWLSSSK